MTHRRSLGYTPVSALMVSLTAASDRVRSGLRRTRRRGRGNGRRCRWCRGSSRSRSRLRREHGRGRARNRTPSLEGHDRRVHQLDERAAFLVPELTDVEVAFDAVDAFDLDEAEHDVARRLGEALAFDDPLAVVRVIALAEEPFQHGGLRLLELKEERVVVVAAEQEHDEGPRADAADADDLARGVHVAVTLEQLAAVTRNPTMS